MVSGVPPGVMTNQKGFSLIEAMVAIVIFAVGILGAYKMQLHSTFSVALANRVSSSVHLATYAIEELLGKAYDHPDLDDKNPPNGSGSTGFAGLNDKGADADGALYVQPDGSILTAASGDDLYSVFWNVAQGTAAETNVLRDVKQIRVHVLRNEGIGSGDLYSHDYFKTEEF